MVIFGSFICIAVNCAPLGHPPKGRVTTSGYSVGSTATYSCEVGYTLEGGNERECLVTGEWSGKEPVCTGKHTYPRVIQLQSSTVDSCLNTPGYMKVQCHNKSLSAFFSSSSPACSY